MFQWESIAQIIFNDKDQNYDSLLCPLFIVGFLWQDFYFEQV